jgi:hypothetical protein
MQIENSKFMKSKLIKIDYKTIDSNLKFGNISDVIFASKSETKLN